MIVSLQISLNRCKARTYLKRILKLFAKAACRIGDQLLISCELTGGLSYSGQESSAEMLAELSLEPNLALQYIARRTEPGRDPHLQRGVSRET